MTNPIENRIFIRIAKKSDHKVLADIHMECGKAQIDAFMHKLGKNFLQTYYRILLEEKNSIVLIALDHNGYGVGFHSGTMKAEEHLQNMKRHKFVFGLSLLPVFIKNPKIIKEVLLRNGYLSSKSNSSSFGVNRGPRGEYWAWRPSAKDPENSLRLHKIWYNIIKEFGILSVKSEVDLSNKRVVKSIKLMGGIFLDEVTLPDGRKRAIVEYKL